jgi:hypothetical protein
LQSHYPFEFEREMGCTAGELRGWLPGASRGAAIEWLPHGARMALGPGTVTIDWSEREPRRIALITLPRLAVRFRAEGVDTAAWHAFMRHFDLYTQRGGG